MSRSVRRVALGLALLLGLAALAMVGGVLADRAEDLRVDTPPAGADPAQVQRGRYLAQVGHCAGCHTARGGAAYAGGRPIATPFGTVFTPNLTADPQSGLGRWSPQAFRRALREGRSADGRALLPACPYPNFSLVEADDADDLFAFLRSLPVQQRPRQPHALRFPYGTAPALAVWRAVHFRPAQMPPGLTDPVQRRGAYLVGGLGHCSACHGRYDRWGANGGAWDLRGGAIPGQGWVAPALDRADQAGLGGWSPAEGVELLRSGRNAHAGVSGPMALVVAHSTQHYDESDLQAVVAFLRALPATSEAAPASTREPGPTPVPPDASTLQQGERLYSDHCRDCHGRDGQGVSDDGPALRGNRALALASPDNVIRMVVGGGFLPATAAQPMPAGMPPFATRLGDEEIAAVVSFIRWRWGDQAPAVTRLDVNRQRGGD